jgi:hypothetical protein
MKDLERVGGFATSDFEFGAEIIGRIGRLLSPGRLVRAARTVSQTCFGGTTRWRPGLSRFVRVS